MFLWPRPRLINIRMLPLIASTTPKRTLVQPKLLRALQEGELLRLCANGPFACTCRLSPRRIATSSKWSTKGSSVATCTTVCSFPLTVPPLRKRREDIPLLIGFFTQRYARKMNRVIEEIPSAALEAPIRCDWPGNFGSCRTWWNAPSF
jgi:formate hydrogenlyase transcriptional activator